MRDKVNDYLNISFLGLFFFFTNGRISKLYKTRTPYEFEQMKSSFPVQALRVYF